MFIFKIPSVEEYTCETPVEEYTYKTIQFFWAVLR